MTLDELLEWARGHVRDVFGDPNPVALAIIDMLGESQPCGFPAPLVRLDRRDPKRGVVTLEDVSGTYEPGELRAMCAMWLHAADEAGKPT